MGKKGTKRKTRWRVLPIGGEDGCNGACSNNDEEGDADRDSSSPLNISASSSTSYARASAQQRVSRTKPSSSSSRGGNFNYRHRSYYQQLHESNQPLVTTEKKMFNEEEYTKITTPRQDVLFKKGYLGRKRPTMSSSAETTANVQDAELNGETVESEQSISGEVMSHVEDTTQYNIYATNGYVDQAGGASPGLYYINGSGYELYDPYSGNVTVVVGPAPHYGGPGVLAAVPCQPLPLQPLEWFNPAFLPYVTAPCQNARDRRKRYSADSQNCSPQSSESTEPPGSPQECDMETTHPGEQPGPAMYAQAPTYVYPGYMFGPPMYNMNGVTVQGAPTQPPPCDVSGSNKRRKKKRRRRRRRGGAEDGCSEESSSDEKELEEPNSTASQESSSPDIESDSKQTLGNDSSFSSPLSSCETLTPIDCVEQSSLAPKDTYSEHGNSVVRGREKEFAKCCMQIKDKIEDINFVQTIKDQLESEKLDSDLASSNSLPLNCSEQAVLEPLVYPAVKPNLGEGCSGVQPSESHLLEEETKNETAVQLNCDTVFLESAETSPKSKDSTKLVKQKKSSKHKKNSKGKEEKQKRPKTSSNNIQKEETKKNNESNERESALYCNTDTLTHHTSLVNGIPSNFITKAQSRTAKNRTLDTKVQNSHVIAVTDMDGNEKPPSGDEQTNNLFEETPARPVRKDKQKTSVNNEKCPDVPKTELEASSSQQIFEAQVSAALLQECKISKNSPVKDTELPELLSSTTVADVDCENLLQEEAIDEVMPPVPPPRCKKRTLAEQLQELEGGNATDESSGDSMTSSTTHESEESVIELLTSTHTSPDDEAKQVCCSDEEEDIIFRAKEEQGEAKITDVKSVPPDKLDVCTPSISGPSVEDSSQISEEKDECVVTKTATTLMFELPGSDVSLEHIEKFADGLSESILAIAVSESAKKRLSLPITEAVTRWLRSQSPEILSLPPVEENETESEVSSEEQELEEENVTGQKNAFCNPLPVPLPECHHDLLVDDDYKNGIGRRVALNDRQCIKIKDENILDKNDNNSIPTIERNVKPECCISTSAHGNHMSCVTTHNMKNKYFSNQDDSGAETIPSGSDVNMKDTQHMLQNNLFGNKLKLIKKLKEDDESSFASEEMPECEWDSWDCNPEKVSTTLTTPVEETLAKTPDDYCSQMCDPTISVAKYYSLGISQKKHMVSDEETHSSTTDDSDEEVDALKHFQHEFEDDDGLQTNGNETNKSFGNPEVYKSYYGEIHSINDSREETERCRKAYNPTLSTRLLGGKSSILVSRLKGDGPFPCGGICCILQ